jgi:hypothetical protein
MIDIEISTDQAGPGLRRLQDNLPFELLKAVDGTARAAETFLHISAPTLNGYTARHIDRDRAGLEVGGGIKAVAGVKRGESNHPLWADQGTGVHVGHSPITPNRPLVIDSESGRRHGGVLTFQKRGEPRRFRKRVSGQAAQHWATNAFRSTLPGVDSIL